MKFQLLILYFVFFLGELRVNCSSQIEHSKYHEREKESFSNSDDIQLSSISLSEETERAKLVVKSGASIYESETTCSDDGAKGENSCSGKTSALYQRLKIESL